LSDGPIFNSRQAAASNHEARTRKLSAWGA
jgi:hypothetical protein